MHQESQTHAAAPPCALATLSDKLLVGIYDLQPNGERLGSLDCYDYNLNLLSSHPTPSAILDVQLKNDKIYTCHSTGEIRVFNNQIEQIAEQKICDSLVTQMNITDNIYATTTNGELIILNNELQQLSSNKLHSLEAWTVLNDGDVTYTGGDDRVLSCFDSRIGCQMYAVKPHDAGVTSILKRGDKLWTGGYDDMLNVFDVQMKRVSNSKNLGGGVWRLVPNDNVNKVLACCMYNGMKILSNDTDDPKVLDEMQVHESMVYGGVWLPNMGPSKTGLSNLKSGDLGTTLGTNKMGAPDWGTTGVTCSFYDKLLLKWQI